MRKEALDGGGASPPFLRSFVKTENRLLSYSPGYIHYPIESILYTGFLVKAESRPLFFMSLQDVLKIERLNRFFKRNIRRKFICQYIVQATGKHNTFG